MSRPGQRRVAARAAAVLALRAEAGGPRVRDLQWLELEELERTRGLGVAARDDSLLPYLARRAQVERFDGLEEAWSDESLPAAWRRLMLAGPESAARLCLDFFRAAHAAGVAESPGDDSMTAERREGRALLSLLARELAPSARRVLLAGARTNVVELVVNAAPRRVLDAHALATLDAVWKATALVPAKGVAR